MSAPKPGHQAGDPAATPRRTPARDRPTRRSGKKGLMTLQPIADGTVMILDGETPLGLIEATQHGIRIHAGIAGDGAIRRFGAPDDPGSTIIWNGEPFTMAFAFRGDSDNVDEMDSVATLSR
jgi:hypothetical protein